MPNGCDWNTTTHALTDDELRKNAEKAGEVLLRWAGDGTDTASAAMATSLKEIGCEGTFWDWLAIKSAITIDLRPVLPMTIVPTEAEADRSGIDRASLKASRDEEETAFFDAIRCNRKSLALALCRDYDAKRRRRAKSGLWAAFDESLAEAISYSLKIEGNRTPKRTKDGLLRAIRSPPVTKHRAIKDVNNLPIGKTYRGGLSMRRLSFLEDVRTFIRRWSCRPRWPSDVRRLSADEKFAIIDGMHIEHIRDHRVKLLGHSAAAVSLGFEQDLRRGLWRYPNSDLWQHPETGRFFSVDGSNALKEVAAPGELDEVGKRRPHRAFDPSHVMAFEDLGRYRFQQDRPKIENSTLNKWSHRRVLKFAQHIGGLFGLPVSLVKADYSSRFCSRCGAPGFRCSRFDPNWLNQQWLQSIRRSKDRRDRSLRETAENMEKDLTRDPLFHADPTNRPWVLLTGGTHFVCANEGCHCHNSPLDADENAAANIGLWFLRGREDFRVRVSGNGTPNSMLQYVVVEKFIKGNNGEWTCSATSSTPKENPATDIDESVEVDGAEGVTLFRDPSSTVLSAASWYESARFWGIVASKAAKGIRAANPERFAPEND